MGQGYQKGVLALVILGLALNACANTRKKVSSGVSNTASTANEETRDGFSDALATPVEDLNLKREQIPPVLAALEFNYKPVTNMTCNQVRAEIRELTAVLGHDDDVDVETLRSEKVGKEIANGTLGVVSDTTGGIIPFRSLVRRATGATAWERKVRKAYERGMVRRAYLKGVGQMKRCSEPGSPNFKAYEEMAKDHED